MLPGLVIYIYPITSLSYHHIGWLNPHIRLIIVTPKKDAEKCYSSIMRSSSFLGFKPENVVKPHILILGVVGVISV